MSGNTRTRSDDTRPPPIRHTAMSSRRTRPDSAPSACRLPEWQPTNQFILYQHPVRFVHQMKCAHCNRELDLGTDVIGIQEGVIGPRGFVQLEDMQLFCSEQCAKDYIDPVDITKLPRRIP